ncbi:MAG TPA: LanC-like protein [Pseudomonadales bacterium]|jgi:hypothetical protein|nr:LanC-like protein [Pseudomonadales bacterium]
MASDQKRAVPLFDPQRHESLTETPWREFEARAAIQRIVADAHAAFSDEGLWPIHPIDRSPERAATLKPIYYGAAGVVWTLLHLQRAGMAEVGRDYLPAIATLLERHRADSLRLTGAPILAYPTGDAGIALLYWTMAPSRAIENELRRVIEGNADHPSLGFGWGGPGSMLAALFMFERTHEPQWRTLYLQLFERVWGCWNYDAAFGCHLWTQDLYGIREQRIGGLHGMAGTVSCMLRGRDLLSAERRSELERRAAEALAATAVRDGALANWPLAADADNRPGILWLQHCSGAPGMVNCLAPLPRDPHVDALLMAAGELTWRAGPTTKLPSLCHGASGSGYAFLKLHARTGDERWLERARRFAMHGIEQAERGVRQHGQRKFSLWTGDLGLAAFLCDCIRVVDRFPTLDTF